MPQIHFFNCGLDDSSDSSMLCIFNFWFEYNITRIFDQTCKLNYKSFIDLCVCVYMCMCVCVCEREREREKEREKIVLN